MPPIQAGIPFYAGVFCLLALLLLAVGVFAAVWLRAGYAILGALLRVAVRVGLYDPDGGGTRDDARPSRDRAVLLFTDALQAVSHRLPNTPRTNTRTVVVPLLLVGVPAVLGLLVVLWVVPATLFGYVLTTAPTPWSLALALGSLVANFAGFLSLVSLGRRLPTLLDGVRPRS